MNYDDSNILHLSGCFHVNSKVDSSVLHLLGVTILLSEVVIYHFIENIYSFLIMAESKGKFVVRKAVAEDLTAVRSLIQVCLNKHN